MESEGRRLGRNAVMLTVRSIIVAIIGLYSSRVILQALGVDDFGVYGVVGGIVGLASFLNASMAGATSRFITYELGTGNAEKLQAIFSTSLRIHFLLALGVVVLAETVGLWFLNYKMVIPAESMFAANVLYQFTILSVIVTFTQVPYNADIIAHEKMNIYAYFEIIFATLKLAIVFLVMLASSQRLILYGALIFFVSLVNALLYRWYCVRHFPEARFSRTYNKGIAKSLLSFSGYDLYGNMCVAMKDQGQPIILNLFYGVVANAGATISVGVSFTITTLTTTIYQAFRPQIIKQYAVGNISAMESLMRRSLQFTVLAYSLVAIPLIVACPNILYVWLGEVPPYSVDFLRLILIAGFFNVSLNVNNAAIHATGNIKKVSFISGTFYLLCPILAYLWLRLGGEAICVYIVNIAMMAIVLIVGWILVALQIPSYHRWLLPIAMLRCIIAVALTCTAIFFLMKTDILSPRSYTEISIFDNFKYALWSFIIATPMLFLFTFFISFSSAERNSLISKMRLSPCL